MNGVNKQERPKCTSVRSMSQVSAAPSAEVDHSTVSGHIVFILCREGERKIVTKSVVRQSDGVPHVDNMVAHLTYWLWIQAQDVCGSVVNPGGKGGWIGMLFHLQCALL